MRVMLDTSVIIDMEKIELGDYARAEPLVSAVSIAELAYGLDTDDPVQRKARTDRYYAVLNAMDVLPFDTTAAGQYGLLASLVRRSGRNPPPRRMDLQIAATASANSLPLLTRNPADFIGLDRVVRVISM